MEDRGRFHRFEYFFARVLVTDCKSAGGDSRLGVVRQYKGLLLAYHCVKLTYVSCLRIPRR